MLYCFKIRYQAEGMFRCFKGEVESAVKNMNANQIFDLVRSAVARDLDIDSFSIMEFAPKINRTTCLS